ncbi:MAG: hypothetical protein ABSH44_18520 [Bryobacteraceae bacterium]
MLAILAWAIPVFAQYAGPAVLSRGEAPAAMSLPQIDFRPFVEFDWVYDTGLTGVGVNSQGQLGNQASNGLEFIGGISGVHSWKHTKIGLDYRGSIRHYTQSTYYDSTDQSLMLGIVHQFSRHATLTLSESAGMFSRNFGLPGLPQTVPFDPSTTNVPTTDFFDNRTIYLSTQANLIIQKTARLSFSLGGDAFLTRRRSTALYGNVGATAHGDVQYRLTRRSTVGVNYTFTHFDFIGVLSSTDLHGVSGVYSVRLSRWLEFSGSGGIARAETKFIQNVPVDPAIAALIGTPEGTVVLDRIDYVTTVSARLSRTFPSGVAYLSGGRGVTPGNGLFLTSITNTVTAGYNYTGLRRWSLGASVNYSSSSSIGNVLGSYGGVSGALSASRQIMRNVHGVVNVNARQYSSGDFSRYNRLIYDVRVGVGYSPGAIPLRIW